MHRVIYIDVLFCVNFIIDFLLLLSVKKYLSLKARYLRMLLGAAVGAISSFVIFLPPMNEILSIFIRIITAIMVVFATFFPIDKKTFVKATTGYFLITFCFCGVIIAIFMIFSPPVSIRNGAVYIDISPIVLVTIIFVSYLIIRIICRITGRSMPRNEICRMIIQNNNQSVEIIAKTDTGNTLKEPFSSMPVIVAEYDKIHKILPNEIKEILSVGYAPENQFGKSLIAVQDKKTENEYTYKLRFVPYNSVGGEGLLPAFKPTCITIFINSKPVEKDAYIAVTVRKLSETFSALIPSEIINN